MYDESIQHALRRSKIQPVEFEVPYLTHLLQNFRGASPHSVILTGTAGDGKTYLCRKIWEGLGGDHGIWESDDKIRRLTLAEGHCLTVIKDLSELRDEDRSFLAHMADAICGQNSLDVFLVASNDGQLVEAWNGTPDSPSVIRVRGLIEDLLVSEQSCRDSYDLILYNLSRTAAAGLLDAILKAVLEHPDWAGCSGCRGQGESTADRCPIWENYARLQQPLFQERLHNLIELCDHSEYHLPIRQLLQLTSNLLLGHAGVKDRLLRCADIPHVVSKKQVALASPYSNVFGENLASTRRDTIEVFEILRRFGIGEETSNRIDNLLIYGNDDATIRGLFDELVRVDAIYGGGDHYLDLQAAYLEGEEPETYQEICETFLHELRRQRQRLFFTMPSTYVESLQLWHLTVFQFAGEYLQKVLAVLQSNVRPSRDILMRLVRGLNRVITGMLTNDEQYLILATSGSYSQAHVSRLEEALIAVQPNRGQRVMLELRDKHHVYLSVYLDRDIPSVNLPLHLVRYEFLSRVAEGALPSSFSRECYEDLLAFKGRLLREHRRLVHGYRERHPNPDEEFTLKLLELDERGFVRSRSIELQF
ncbi:MAG: hypothetical protein AB7N91_14655 [Candidatus Tectimicrobiota bacterium]